MSTPTSKGPWEDTDIDPLILQAMRGLPVDFADFPRIFQDDLLPSLQAQEAEAQLRAAWTRASPKPRITSFSSA